MGTADDFRLWERELREAADAAAEPRGRRGMLVTSALVVTGCTMMIIMGQRALGAAGLGLSALILLLWRAGM
jgi:hypothetical protein